MSVTRSRAFPAVATALLLAAMTFQAVTFQDAAAEERNLADVQALTRAYNASGQMLFRDFAASPGNVVFSPYSVGTAMAMVLAGTRGGTEREMAAVLQHSLARAQINDANAAAIAFLNGYNKGDGAVCPPSMRLKGDRCEAEPDSDTGCPHPSGQAGDICIAEPKITPSAKLLVANALMFARGQVAKNYAALIKDRYSAEVFQRASLETVNGWVKQRTEGKIEKILDKPSDVVLINAVYFKSRWAVAFDKTFTKDEAFNLTRSRQEMVPTMLQRANHAVVSRNGYRAIKLPYMVGSLAMVIALPNDVEGLGDIARRLDINELTPMFATLRTETPRLVDLMLPRFKAAYSADLKDSFRKAGMTLAFDPRRSDFSGLTGVPPQTAPTAIDQIVHRAVIDVAEESTEAAAATATGVWSSAIPVEPMQFRVDRPFLYYLIDDVTGAVLFQGRVVDPRYSPV
jgi:serpin B